MKTVILLLILFAFLLPAAAQAQETPEAKEIVLNDSFSVRLRQIAREHGEVKQAADTIPPDGTYRFDIAFAEWGGISMGKKVTVIINGDSIRVIYEGDEFWEKGEFENGKIMKHKSCTARAADKTEPDCHSANALAGRQQRVERIEVSSTDATN